MFRSLLQRLRPAPAPQRYGCERRRFHLDGYGVVEYEQWLHPKERPKEITGRDVAWLRRFIEPGDTVIDIGAHTGDTTLPMALAAGPEGCTLAFEPNPFVFEVLERNAALNPEITNIRAFCWAATREDGELVFHYSDAGYCNGGYLAALATRRHGHGHELTVQGRDLSRFLRRRFPAELGRLSFVKIDTEGHDRAVIESLAGILEETRPTLVAEAYQRLTAGERDALYDAVTGLGYTPREIGDEGAGRRLERGDFHQRRHFDFVAVPETGQRASSGK